MEETEDEDSMVVDEGCCCCCCCCCWFAAATALMAAILFGTSLEGSAVREWSDHERKLQSLSGEEKTKVEINHTYT